MYRDDRNVLNFFFLSIMTVFDLIDLCVSLHIRGMKKRLQIT